MRVLTESDLAQRVGPILSDGTLVRDLIDTIGVTCAGLSEPQAQATVGVVRRWGGAAKTPGAPVASDSGLISRPPQGATPTLVPSGKKDGSGASPMAIRTISMGISNSVPSTGTGLRRPFSSGSERAMR